MQLTQEAGLTRPCPHTWGGGCPRGHAWLPWLPHPVDVGVGDSWSRAALTLQGVYQHPCPHCDSKVCQPWWPSSWGMPPWGQNTTEKPWLGAVILCPRYALESPGALEDTQTWSWASTGWVGSPGGGTHESAPGTGIPGILRLAWSRVPWGRTRTPTTPLPGSVAASPPPPSSLFPWARPPRPPPVPTSPPALALSGWI